MFEFEFFRNALVGVVIMSVVSAIVGTYIVSRRQVFISGGITHACFGGLGLGYLTGLSPMWMAVLFAIGGSLGVDALSRDRRVRRDTAIAVVWATGMALGILFIFLRSGYAPDLNSFLFGNVLTITRPDLWLFSAYTLAIILFFFIFKEIIIAVSFDEAFAATRRLPVRFINVSMTVIVALGIVLTIRMAGIMLLMSLLSLPQMTAEIHSRRYMRIMLWALVYALVGSVGGLFAAYWLDVPASATIVLLLVLLYVAVSLSARLVKRKIG